MFKPRILIVEDTKTIGMMVSAMVEAMGGKVVGVAQDGVEAIEKYKELKPNLTLMDIEMPNKNGVEALKEILSTDQYAKVVMLTAVSDISVAEECLEIGAHGYLLKELDDDEFKEGLQDHIKTA